MGLLYAPGGPATSVAIDGESVYHFGRDAAVVAGVDPSQLSVLQEAVVVSRGKDDVVQQPDPEDVTGLSE